MRRQNKDQWQILVVAGLLAIVAVSCQTTSPEKAFQQAERLQNSAAFERFARSYAGSPLAAEARKRAAELREKQSLALLEDLLKKATKASQIERFIAEHPHHQKLILMAKFRIAEIDYQDLETKNPFRPYRSGNTSWDKFVSHYAFGEYITVPDDPDMRKMYYDKLHPLLISALALVESYEAWMRYLSTYPESPYFQLAAEQVEKLVLVNADKWESYDLLKNYLDFYDLKLNRPCPNRKALVRKYEQSLAEAAKKEDTKQAYLRYLSLFPDSPERDTIVLHKDKIELAEARSVGDRAKVEELIEQYKSNDAAEAQSIVSEGKVYLEQLDFGEATRAGTPRALEDFIAHYKDRDEANLIPKANEMHKTLHDAWLARVKATGNPNDYDSFLGAFPNSPARQQVLQWREEAEFKKALASKDRRRIEQALLRYPASALRPDAEKALDDLDWEEAKSQADAEPSTAPLKVYLDRKPPGQHAAEARTRMATLDKHFAAYSTQLTLARQARDASLFYQYLSTARDNPYATKRGEKDLEILRRDQAIQQLLADLSTTAPEQARAILPIALTKRLRDYASVVVSVETSAGNCTGFIFLKDGFILTDGTPVRASEGKPIVARVGEQALSARIVAIGQGSAADFAVLSVRGSFAPIPVGNASLVPPPTKVRCLSASGTSVEPQEGDLLQVRQTGPKEWIIIKSEGIKPQLGGVIISHSGRAIGLVVPHDRVDPAIKAEVAGEVYAVSLRCAQTVLAESIGK